MAKHKLGDKLDEIEFAESKLAESRDRLHKFRDSQNSFIAGSAERAQAATIIQEIELLHRVLGRLCRRLRGSLH